jgi:hypothetical protein
LIRQRYFETAFRGGAVILEYSYNSSQRLHVGDVLAFENRQSVTAAKFINKSSLLILLVSVIHRLERKPNSENS